VTRTRNRIAAALTTFVVIAVGGMAIAAPAAAIAPTIDFTMKFEYLNGSTWTTIPTGTTYTPVLAGTQSARFTVTNIGGELANLGTLFAGASNYNNSTGSGIDRSDCPVLDGVTGKGYDSVTGHVFLPAGASIVCSKALTFRTGQSGFLYGVGGVGVPSGIGWSFGNQEHRYRGIDNTVVGTAEVTDTGSTYVPSADPTLQQLPAGQLPTAKFAFTNAGNTSDITGVTYSSTGTASVATACPGLATTFVYTPTPVGSGDCTVDLLPATQAPQTVTITMNGTGALGPVSNTITFTYAAAAAECTTPESSYAAGATVTVTCTGFEPSLSVAAVLHSAPVALGSFSTGAGAFTFSFTIPATFDAGSHSVTLNFGTSTLVITSAFTVTAALASTGVEIVLPLTLAVIMLALGAALLVYRRRAAKRA
jgi:hypothetical protein